MGRRRGKTSGEHLVATSEASPEPDTRKHPAVSATAARPTGSTALKRIKATFLDHILWTQFNLKLVWEGKTLQDWVQEQIADLNRIPLSSIRPVPDHARVRLLPSELERKHWVPVRVDPTEYRKARWRWSAMGVSMTEWFYKRILDYCGNVDLDAAEKAIMAREQPTRTPEQSAAPALTQQPPREPHRATQKLSGRKSRRQGLA